MQQSPQGRVLLVSDDHRLAGRHAERPYKHDHLSSTDDSHPKAVASKELGKFWKHSFVPFQPPWINQAVHRGSMTPQQRSGINRSLATGQETMCPSRLPQGSAAS